MPRQRKPGSGEPKTRSRHGCRQCKQRKIKCGEQKPACANCEKTDQDCDYSMKLNWEAKTKRKSGIQNHMTVDGIDLVETKVDSPTTSLPDQPTMDFSPTGQFDRSATLLSRGPTMPRRTGSGHFEAGFIKDPANPYPSPADSQLDENGQLNGKRSSFVAMQHYGDMPPPTQISPRGQFGTPSYYSHGYKRAKVSPTDQQLYNHMTDGGMAHRNSFGSLNTMQAINTAGYSPPPNASGGRVPPSPVASSIESDESAHSKTRASQLAQPDRRMSIESLISGGHGQSTVDGALTATGSLPSQSSTPKAYHGIDPGYPDFDVPFNHDDDALNDATPSINSRPKSVPKNGFGIGPYPPFYKSPGIKVRIPEEFEPLPKLLTKQINLLYFHHFISHTARILVPHDCSGNPFRKILPRMAIKDENLLRLLLAYSASHRSRLMNYPLPSNRISQYVEGMFQRLSAALYNQDKQMSNSTFATAIMLSSLEIISPNAFKADIPISWNMHLSMAANIINERGIHAQTVDRSDEETYFLTRWFAYLDVLGCLSGGRTTLPLFGGDFWADDPSNPGQAHRIDCFFGFTDRCVQLLARIATLTHESDTEQATHNKTDPNKPYEPSSTIVAAANKISKELQLSLRQPYQGCNHAPNHRQSTTTTNSSSTSMQPLSPSTTTSNQARIRRPSSPAPPTTYNSPNGSSTTHALELTTTNESYHWAGQIYLLRRILRRPPSDSQLQLFVSIIVNGLGKIQEGGTAEACMLFPIFVAGCEAVYEPHDADAGCNSGDEAETAPNMSSAAPGMGTGADGKDGGKWRFGARNSMRRILYDRVRSIEETGLTQARRARELMELVWKARDEGGESVGWEGLVGQGFIVC